MNILMVIHIIDIMKKGAIIIRFKYVSRNKFDLPPQEKVVSYHPMEFENKKVLWSTYRRRKEV
jgi:hypothetical protein